MFLFSDDEENEDGITKPTLIKFLKKLKKMYKNNGDKNAIANSFFIIISSRDNEIISEKYSEKLLLWVSKWTNERDHEIPDDDETDNKYKVNTFLDDYYIINCKL